MIPTSTPQRSTGRRSPIDVALDELGTDPRLVHVQRLPANEASFGALARPLPEALGDRLPHTELWSHQVTAIDLIRNGTSVAIASGTGSGKSLCYQIPAIETALSDGGTTLAVFPTKALAADQLSSLAAWGVPGVTPAAYDGDCTPQERTWVRSNADIVLTNPEMLHHGILSNHARWGPFLHDLRYVVIDELHTLRGVFGTHVAQVLRRLRRLVQHYGGKPPTFVFTSATIGDPERLAAELCGLDVVAVPGDGGHRGDRTVALWHPGEGAGHSPDEARWSVHNEAALVAARLVKAGLRTLVFCRSRRGTELVATDIRRSVGDDLSDSIRSYRAGYLAAERREIESLLFSGELRCVVATNALELGVDIGGLDAVVLCGFPGTIASFWQQVGRAGRSTDPSLAVMVAGEDQLDQWMLRHPDQLFSRPPEPAVINLDNPHVYLPHVACAAHELPLTHDDHSVWPDQLDDAVRELVLTDRAAVRHRKGNRRVVWTGRGTPAPTIGLRSASTAEFTICTEDEFTIGTVDSARIYSATHPGAVYLHQGTAWKVVELDEDRLRVIVEPADPNTYTQPRSETEIRLLRTDDKRPVGRSMLHVGELEVTTQVVGYRVRSTLTRETLVKERLELPPSTLRTRGVWYCFDNELISEARIDDPDLGGALHALEHAAIGMLPLFTICDRWDVGGVSTPWLDDTASPTVVIHDAHPGGAGIAELAFDAADRHLAATLTSIEECGCEDGCPSCVQSPKCGNNNEPLDKAAAVRLLRATL